MDELSRRLRDQRTHLKLNQEEFGSACGVRRRAQAAYESGKRVPDADYLIRAGRLGADLKFVLTGIRSTDAEREKLAVDWLVRALCEQLGIPSEVADSALARAANVEASPPGEFGKAQAIAQTAQDMLRRSGRLNDAEVVLHLDRDLLTDAIREQEAAWHAAGKLPSAVQKSHRFATIYEDAARTGQVNPNLVEGSDQVTSIKGDKAA